MNKKLLPNFIIIGAPNSGSTSLWFLLRQHPDIFMPEEKEPRFFTKKDFDKKWNEYNKLFANVRSETAIGEASVNYSEIGIWPETPNIISNYIPNIKIIYIVRNPIKRIESCWKQALSSGHWITPKYNDKKMSLNFDEAIYNFPHLVESCKYWTNIQAYRKFIPDNRILLLFFEDFVKNPSVSLNQICKFLNVNPSYKFKKANQPKNKGKNKKMMRPVVVKIVKNDIIRKLGKNIPQPMKECLNKSILKKNVPRVINWNKETKEWVIKKLNEEVSKTLLYGKKPEEFWECF